MAGTLYVNKIKVNPLQRSNDLRENNIHQISIERLLSNPAPLNH